MFTKIERQYPKALQNNELAQRAFYYTLQVIEGSSNRLSKEEMINDINNIINRINFMRAEPLHHEEFTIEWIQEIAALTLKYNVGNCCEKACTVFDFIYQKSTGNELNLELFNNPFIDHFFVVIGREICTDPTDPRTWNPDTIICDPWIEERSYFIGEIDFQNLAENKREVINYLLSAVGSTGPLILYKDVLGLANGDKKSLIISQSCMVLRTQFYNGSFTRYNHNVPVIYEAWDLPQEKHYTKHQKQLAENTFFATKSALHAPKEVLVEPELTWALDRLFN
jgi:hypothetical protein